MKRKETEKQEVSELNEKEKRIREKLRSSWPGHQHHTAPPRRWQTCFSNNNIIFGHKGQQWFLLSPYITNCFGFDCSKSVVEIWMNSKLIWFKYVVRVYSSSCSPVDVEKDKSQRLKTDLWHSVKTLWICWLQTFQQFNLQEEQGAEEGDGGRGRGRSQHLRGGEGDGGDAGERERECITGYRLSLVTELMGFCLFPSPRCLLNRGLCIEKDH